MEQASRTREVDRRRDMAVRAAPGLAVLALLPALWSCSPSPKPGVGVASRPEPAATTAPAPRPAEPSRPRATSSSAAARAPTAPPESSLGLADKGIFSELDGRVQLGPPLLSSAQLHLDSDRGVAVLLGSGHPFKAYPLPANGGLSLSVGVYSASLRPGDHAELSALQPLSFGATAGGYPDADSDGIPDPLDLLIGAEKAVLNGAEYSDKYFSIKYPLGDAPRDRGACVDVIVRALRNAGYDLQELIAKDIRRAPGQYGVEKPDSNIDHRRVRNLFVYAKRHLVARSSSKSDSADPLLPGDIVLLDTLSKPGPDHVGIVSTRTGASGFPTLINNWTFGHRTAHMDLLSSYAVMYRYRLPAAK